MFKARVTYLTLCKATVALALFLQGTTALYALADISFIVIDLKYNQEQGVKICEMQPGSFSRFSGADSLPKMYCDLLAEYQVPLYFTHPLYQKMKEEFIAHGWSSIHSIKNLVTKIGDAPVGDPDNLFDYQCFLFSLNSSLITNGYPSSFPQILFLDRAILPYSENKYTMNLLFDSNKETKKLRPQWRIYQKGTSEKLVNTIINDIPGNLLVIKPLQSTMGRGVIILEKNNLQGILNYIFSTDKEILLADLERSYSHYAVDTSDYFIVEEFVPSDPLLLGPDLLPYDCTMRITAVLSYHQCVANITFLAGYWYSPHKPLDEAYTLIQSHKAKGTFFCPIAPEIAQEVERQLRPALLILYQTMLDQYE